MSDAPRLTDEEKAEMDTSLPPFCAVDEWGVPLPCCDALDCRPCAVNVCDRPQPHGVGGVCDKCEEVALNHGALLCPVSGVHLCDTCGAAPFEILIGGDSSPLFVCESCLPASEAVPVEERDWQTTPDFIRGDTLGRAANELNGFAVAWDSTTAHGAAMLAIIEAGLDALVGLVSDHAPEVSE